MEQQEFWNEKNLPVPNFLSYPASRREIDITKFKNHLEKSITHFSQMSSFYEEVNQLSQFLYLGENQFRMMKGFQEMKKTYQSAMRVRNLDICSILENFNSYVSDNLQSEIHIPFRQNLDYVLIRLQGLSKLFIRLIACSRNSVKYLLGLIRAGSFYIKGSLFIGTLATIWDLSRNFCKHTVALYNDLRVFRESLKQIEELEWIANNCYLPERLDTWLSDDFENLVNNETYDFKLLTKIDDINSFIEKNERFTQICDDSTRSKTIINNDDDDDEDISLHASKRPKIELELEDYTPISRNSIKELMQNNYVHSISSLTTKKNIELFLKHEDKYRKKNDAHKSLTIKKMESKDWKNFKKEIKNKLNFMQETIIVEYTRDYMSYYE